ncbi:MAG: MFS transporter [Thaumarchaeota archaeon]|nr:MFS transporter [Nitrososphaerota archaeon]
MKTQASSDLAKIVAPLSIYFLFYFSMSMVYPFVGLYAVSGGATPLEVGYIYASFYAVSLLTRIPLTGITYLYGRRFSLLLGLVITTLGTFALPVSKEPLILLMANGLRGLGFSIFQPAIISLIVDVKTVKIRQEQAIGYIYTAPPAGQTLGPALGGIILATLSFEPLFTIAAALLLVSASVTLLTIMGRAGGKQPETRQDKSTATQVKEIFSPDFTLNMYSRVTVSYVLEAMTAFLPLFAVGVLGMATWEMSLLFSLAFLVNISARPIAGWLAGRSGEKKVISLGCGLSGASCAVVALSATPFGVWAAMPLYGYGIGAAVPPAYSYAGKVLKKNVRTLGLAILTLAIDLGHTVGSIVSATLLSYGGYSLLFLGAFTFALTGSLAQFVSLRLAKSQQLVGEKRSG